jgi:DNA mismatch repair protein MutS
LVQISTWDLSPIKPMSFESILFEKAIDRPVENPELPEFFTDLNLDQIIECIIKDRPEYNLKPFFWYPLKRIGAIGYRHEIMQELEREEPAQIIKDFAKQMRTMHRYLTQGNRLLNPLQKGRWFLDAVNIYCEAVNALFRDLLAVELKSRGLLAFREYLKEYSNSISFISLIEDTRRMQADIEAVNYRIEIKGKEFTVRRSESEVDFSAEVEKTFERFKQGDAKDYMTRFSEPVEMDELESTILEAVAQLFPEVFYNLDSYCRQHVDFADETINVFDREIQFYVGYLEFIDSIKAAGLAFCYPEILDTSKAISQQEGFDLALANKLVAAVKPIVCNDLFLKDNERICIISGPNQGGKTTFARAFGQAHYLASLGCPVPGKDARLFLFDKIFTHFEKEENVEDLRSKLEDDLTRIRDILNGATSRSIIIANEVLTSTTLDDAIFLGKRVMESLTLLDALCVWVTFVEELASYSNKAVSMVSMVEPENPSLRTYKIARRPPHGLSFAAAIARKYGLTYEALRERIK